jgi:hypothetical protein
VPEIREDAKRYTGREKDMVNGLIKKLMVPECETEEEEEVKGEEICHKFWEEHAHFQAETGPFANRRQIWNSPDIFNDATHRWHAMHSLRYTEVFGKFACIVTSKQAGIGNCERQWGVTKRLKDGQRSHLSPRAVTKLTTLNATYGQEKAESARSKRETYGFLDESNASRVWDEDDFKTLGLTKYGIDVDYISGAKKPVQIFRAFVEPWEPEAIKLNDPVAEAKLLKKYGGIALWDFDHDRVITISAKTMTWNKSRKADERGWQVKGMQEEYDEENDINDEQGHLWDPWVINNDLFLCIVEYYERNPSTQIKIVKQDMAAAAAAAAEVGSRGGGNRSGGSGDGGDGGDSETEGEDEN